MQLSELLFRAKIVTGTLAADPAITGVCADSRRIREGMLYIAVEGLHVDGHRFLREAIAGGAVACVVSKNAMEDGRAEGISESVPTVAVANTREALSWLFSAWHGHPASKMRLVGVTGTNGKTSVSRMLYRILTHAGIRTGLIGTAGCLSAEERLQIPNADPNANMTTPDPEQLFEMLSRMRDDGVETVVMEVTSHALALSKVEPLFFDVAVFTNLTEDHLDLHGDMEAYYSVKARLFNKCRRAVINCDDRYGRRLAEEVEIPVYLCTAEGRKAAFSAWEIRENGTRGMEYKLSSRALRLRVRTPLSGGFQVMNTMQAAVTAHLLGVQTGEIREVLSHFSGVEGRLERLKLGGVDFSVYLDYAHTPDALETLLRTVRGFTRRGERIVLVFGCGGDRDRGKRPIMGRIATELADLVVVTGDNSRSERTADIIRDILSGVVEDAELTVIEDRRLAIEYAVKNARRGDVILLAGKGHENYEITAEGKRPFNEKEIVQDAVERYHRV